MKIKALIIAAGLTISTAAAGYAVVGDRYKVAIDPQVQKCHKASNRIISEDASSRLLGVSTVKGYAKTVTMKFAVTSVFGNSTHGVIRCRFAAADKNELTGLSLNGYTYSHDQVFLIDTLADL